MELKLSSKGKEILQNNNIERWIKKITNDIKLEEGRTSDLHKEVSRLLKQINIDHENEYYIPELKSKVDIKISNKNKKGKVILLEIDGPSHFQSDNLKDDKSKVEKLQSKMRKRHLKAIGYHVITIPYYEWDQLNKNMKEDYLKKLNLIEYTL